MKKRDLKNWHILVSIVAVLFFAFLVFRNLNEPGDAKKYVRDGNSYFNGSAGYNLVKAEEAFKKALKIDPKILWGHYQLALSGFLC